MPTVTGGLIENVGQFASASVVKVTSPGTTSIAVTIPGLNTINGQIVQVLNSGNNVKGGAVGPDITVSGNVMTIADGSNFSLANTDTIYIMAWGSPNA